MKIIIELDDTSAVGVHIDGIVRPTQSQAFALRNLAMFADEYREELLNNRLGIVVRGQ